MRSHNQQACSRKACYRALRATYKRRPKVTIDCAVCEKTVVRKKGRQVTCLSEECKAEQTRTTNRLYARRQRKVPTCRWCKKLIHELYRRVYHAVCWTDMNRERARVYNQTKPPRQIPKRPHKYKGKFTCKICKERTQITGPRQIICRKQACLSARRNQVKRDRLFARKQIEALRQKKQKAFDNRSVKSSPSIRLVQPLTREVARVS